MVIPGGVAGLLYLESETMSEQLTLPAEARERAGKGASRALRRDGRVPAVIYGDKKEPLAVHVEEKLLAKMLSTGHFMNTIVMVDAGGEPHRTLPKDVQFHPVSSRPIHVDFLRIGEHSQITVAIPVRFDDDEESPGIKRGGVLNIVQHELELVCDASRIPDEIHISLAGLDIGDSIHINQVSLPEGTKSAIDDRDFTVATIVAPSAMKAEADEAAEAAAAAAAAEGEVPTVGEDEAEGEGEEGEKKGEDSDKG
jgi:large subunit ribosomal protein L25